MDVVLRYGKPRSTWRGATVVSPYIYPGLQVNCSHSQYELRQVFFHRVWGAVAKACGIDPATRHTVPGRKQEVVMARYLAMYIATEGVTPSQKAYFRHLAEFFGRHRTTVYHAIKVVENMIAVYGERWEYYRPLFSAMSMLNIENDSVTQ